MLSMAIVASTRMPDACDTTGARRAGAASATVPAAVAAAGLTPRATDTSGGDDGVGDRPINSAARDGGTSMVPARRATPASVPGSGVGDTSGGGEPSGRTG